MRRRLRSQEPTWLRHFFPGIAESPVLEAFQTQGPQEVFRLFPVLTRWIAFWSLLSLAFTGLPLPVEAADVWTLSSGTDSAILAGGTSVLGLGLVAGTGSVTTLGGGSLLLGGSGLSLALGAGTLNLDATGTLGISGDTPVFTAFGTTFNLAGALAGNGSLLKLGDGVWRFAGAGGNAFSGDVTAQR